MPRSLVFLIRASGYTGVAGQSFRDHVAQAGTGRGMTMYNFGGADIAGQPTADVGTYLDNSEFTASIEFAVNASYFQYIQRTITNSTYWSHFVTGGEGASSSILSITSTTSTHVNVVFRVRSPYRTDGTLSGSSAFTNTPSASDPEPVSFTGGASNPGTAPVSTLVGQFSYTPDGGPYNPTITNGTGWSAPFRQRDWVASEFTWEWYGSAADRTASTNIIAATQSFSLSSGTPLAQSGGTLPGQSITVYFRARYSSGAEAALGAVSWTDPRTAS